MYKFDYYYILAVNNIFKFDRVDDSQIPTSIRFYL